MLSYLEILRMPNAAMSVVATVLTALIVGFYDPVQIALASLCRIPHIRIGHGHNATSYELTL
jgi:hypothetical protein